MRFNCWYGIETKKERKEQFATILCRTAIDDYGFEYLIADDFQIWPSENLEQSEVFVSPKSWDWVTSNILTKNKADDYHISTVVSLHTHPEWFGTDRNLDADDTETFKIWTQAFRNAGIDMINGIVSSNGGLKLYRYNSETDTFDNIICQGSYINEKGKEDVTSFESTLPEELKDRRQR